MRALVGRLNVARRVSLAPPPEMVYPAIDLQSLPLEDRTRLAAHSLTTFPVWAVGVLNVVTLGLFPLIHFGLMHDRLPQAATTDPSAGKAIGFYFIPYYNLHWLFFNALRLSDRLSLQLELRDLPERAPRRIMLAAAILTVIPYANVVIAIPILWTIAVCMLQSTVNRIARLSPRDGNASLLEQVQAEPARG